MTAVGHDDVILGEEDVERDCTLVWIDAEAAVVARWHDGAAHFERLHSDVPPHHRSTGHLRYDPVVSHGGGAPRDAGEPRRLEHLARFVDRVERHVPPTDALLILGHGNVRERLERAVREADRRASRDRTVECHALGGATDRQLVARLKAFAGAGPLRRTSGPYRPSQTGVAGGTGMQLDAPRRSRH